MSDPIEELPAPELPPAFVEYEVEGVGTVIAPEGEPGYRVRLPSGAVTAFPALSGEPCEDNAAADIAHALANPPPAPVPAVVRAAALRYVLNRRGLRVAVETAVAQAPQDAQDAWEYEVNIRRFDPLVLGFAEALGLSSALVDDIFREGDAK